MKFSGMLSGAFIFLFPVLIMFGCRSSKKLQTTVTGKDSVITVLVNPTDTDSVKLVHDAFGRIRENTIDFNTFSAKIKVDYKDTRQQKYDFNSFARIRKDSVIWISISAVLGIEAFRVLITPDSVKIMNRLDNYVQFHTTDYIREITQLPVDFYILQDILIGNPFYMDSTNVLLYKESENTVSLSTLGAFFKQLFIVRKDDFAITHSKLDDVDITRHRTADFSFGEYDLIQGRLFSAKRNIVITEKNRLDITLDFKQMEFDKALTYPFNVPKNYTKK
ncbi:MAG: DUF4292 domain-containing protein [Chitinophagaceae bacterium]|nr:DUF4292 domain-containing protein [Chitinophagaceae bacterium]MCW5927663.1 DUF4292 domain-containing protein [Chitinophagaceae bacterium]